MALRISLITALAFYALMIIPFTSMLKQRPVAQKVGYIAQPEVVKFISADQSKPVSAYLVMKVLTYFGGLTPDKKTPPDYYGMYKILQAGLLLDPYNLDGYYFLQSIIAWDSGQVVAVNKLIEQGMKYRDWDYMLPFFAAFNYSYFLKNYKQAAVFYKKAGELSGDSVFISIAGRYLYESQQTEQAIMYLKTMIKSAKTASIAKSLEFRLKALTAAREIELAIVSYQKQFNKMPADVTELVTSGIISKIPSDPYGGEFYIDMAGAVRTTSNLYSVKNDNRKDN